MRPFRFTNLLRAERHPTTGKELASLKVETWRNAAQKCDPGKISEMDNQVDDDLNKFIFATWHECWLDRGTESKRDN